ncbi:MAG TPA: hypothetical protein PLO23_05275 [Alphaproteobacteria bacterium]|nr:hypothetical protein [Alphaproteobacteria bacterium]
MGRISDCWDYLKQRGQTNLWWQVTKDTSKRYYRSPYLSVLASEIRPADKSYFSGPAGNFAVRVEKMSVLNARKQLGALMGTENVETLYRLPDMSYQELLLFKQKLDALQPHKAKDFEFHAYCDKSQAAFLQILKDVKSELSAQPQERPEPVTS